MDVVSLQHGNDATDRDGALVRGVLARAAQSLDRRRFVAERFEERERKLSRIEELFDELANCFFDLNRVQPFDPSVIDS